jgi:hypothetical protein
MDEIGDLGVRHVASLGRDSGDWPRDMSAGDFVFPRWECGRGSGAPTGHGADVSQVPGVGNAGLLSDVPPGQSEGEPVVFSYLFGTSARSAGYRQSSVPPGQMRGQQGLVSYPSGTSSGVQLLSSAILWDKCEVRWLSSGIPPG